MIEFLKFLRRSNCGRKIAVFLDNCSIHRCKEIYDFSKKIKLKFVYNIPYSPQLNGIEQIGGSGSKN